MKNFRYFFPVIAMVCLYGCLKQQFYPDPDDPKLSKFTDKQFQTGTCYINDTAYINEWPASGFSLSPAGPPYPELTKSVIEGTHHILFSWPIQLKDGDSLYSGKYQRISFSIPVSEGFGRQDLKDWKGKIFRSIPLGLGAVSPFAKLQGSGDLYIIKLTPSDSDSGKVYLSGLFNGQIGDSIFIQKGRFDYVAKVGGF